MIGRLSPCRRYEPALVAHVYGEPHRDRAALLGHLRACPACRRNETDLRAVRDAIAESLGRGMADGGGGLELASAPEVPRSRPAGGRSLLARAVPACAVVLIACLAFGGKGDLGRPRTAPSPAASIFGASALGRCRNFDGSELDRRMDWVAGLLAGLGGDPW